ncbi:hypothetical protein F9U39_04560 [Pectobacterium versatile]|nr:hypothetical protein [Pectobacterium versatile]
MNGLWNLKKKTCSPPPSYPRNTAAWTRRTLKDINAIFAEMKDGEITDRMVIDLPR